MAVTEEDLNIADEILDCLTTDPMKSLKLYVQAKPEVKKMLGSVDPRELLINIDPKIETEKVMTYIDAQEHGNEPGMKRAYKSSNELTRNEIDDLFK
ncbi:hypothetical protein HOK51_09640 [Candidatus Woesearchaeota archaeon]|nr:hypothetical protein [Candidatus Woesearchaeota archaeon]MBT6520085.1 hypothetical protein [Candidatus Woesearchaeota archaeon]MBT7366690.1 hypothetical protein [Candidatus Woesearchaeota archaeon]